MPLSPSILNLIAAQTVPPAQSYDTNPIPGNSDFTNVVKSSQKFPSIVLVHGGWQTPKSYALLEPLLTKAGYKVIIPTLPSSNSAPAVPDSSLDVSAVRSPVEIEISQGRDVVLVMHSYGAAVGCEAVRGLGAIKHSEPEKVGVIRLIFISGMVLPVGGSPFTTIGSPKRIPGWRVQDNLVTVDDGPTRFYNDLPRTLAEDLSSKLTPQSLPALKSRLTHAAYREIPSSYLLCTLDCAVKKKAQLFMIGVAGITDVVSIEAGHMPFAHPEKVGMVAKFILSRAHERLQGLSTKL